MYLQLNKCTKRKFKQYKAPIYRTNLDYIAR